MSDSALQALITTLTRLPTVMDRFATDIHGVNDPDFQERATRARALALALCEDHLPDPSFDVVLDVESVFRAIRNLRVPEIDPDLGEAMPTAEKIRAAVGNLVAYGLDIQDAARLAYPDQPSIGGAPRPITEGDKPRIKAALAGLEAFANAVEDLRAERDTAPNFKQQGAIVVFYARKMSVRIDTVRLHLTVNDLTLDVPALVATVEATRQVSNRFVANVEAWRDRVSKTLPGRAENAHAVLVGLIRDVSRLAGMAIGDVPVDDDGPEMVLIPPGNESRTFTMGIPEAESQREGNPSWDRHARPQHEVTIRHRFLLGKYPVTRGEYAEFARATDRPWKDPDFPQTDRHPAVMVSHDEAVAYAKWLSDRTRHHYRLPTEAEWEYACRAGTETARYWGDRHDAKWLHIGGGGTAEVGSYPANPWGLHDMLGNVWEWCADTWHDNYQGAPTDGSAWDADATGSRVVRGGSWINNRRYLRSGDRDLEVPAGSSPWVGFRLARTL